MEEVINCMSIPRSLNLVIKLEPKPFLDLTAFFYVLYQQCNVPLSDRDHEVNFQRRSSTLGHLGDSLLYVGYTILGTVSRTGHLELDKFKFKC
jgi:hypothetical protein